MKNAFYERIYQCVVKYAQSPENIDEHGLVDWCFVDADCFREINPTKNCQELYYKYWNEIVEKLVP